MLGVVGEIGVFGGALTEARKAQLTKMGHLYCDGRDLPVDDYRALFRTIGRAYVHPNETLEGRFRIPDMRGRTPVGADGGFLTTAHPLGSYFGDESVVLAEAHLPPHNHANGAFNQLLMMDSSWTLEDADYTSGEPGLIRSQPLVTVGQGLAHPNVQPSLSMHFFIRFRSARELQDLVLGEAEEDIFLG